MSARDMASEFNKKGHTDEGTCPRSENSDLKTGTPRSDFQSQSTTERNTAMLPSGIDSLGNTFCFHAARLKCHLHC